MQLYFPHPTIPGRRVHAYRLGGGLIRIAEEVEVVGLKGTYWHEKEWVLVTAENLEVIFEELYKELSAELFPGESQELSIPESYRRAVKEAAELARTLGHPQQEGED